MKLFRKKFLWSGLYTVLLVSFTIYVLFDTFVITRVYTNVVSDTGGDSDSLMIAESDPVQTESEQETEASTVTEQSEGSQEAEGTAASPQAEVTEENETSTEQANTAQATATAVITENSYNDRDISITITEYREYDTTIYVADVTVSSIEYLRTALADNSYGKNVTEKTSEIAESNNAILAINGDYYGSQNKGYVLRNGVLYRKSASSNQEDLVIWNGGSFEIITEGEVAAQDLLDNGALQILSFGPALVMNSSIAVDESEEVGKAKASNPRTAIGIIDDLNYVFVVSDGRTDESEGLTLYQLAEFMQSLNVEIAYNLDGGGSSTMYLNGEVINNPTTSGRSIKERSVSDIVYIGY